MAQAIPCTICGKPSSPSFRVGTGGGCDYEACSKAHASMVWDAIDAFQAGEEGLAPMPKVPFHFPPQWTEFNADELGSEADFAAWLNVPANRAALLAVRGA